jgi:predicted nucleotidyltransferase
LRDVLADDLVGVYVHGSLALGCFNEARSDIDVIAVTAGPLGDDDRFAVADLFLHVSARPYGLEAHLVTSDRLRPWRYPPPYDFHYGESRRERLALDPTSVLERPTEGDADLAAHVDVARGRGIALHGPPPVDVFPEVPRADLEDSLRRDLAWCRSVRSALYGVLSPCRVWAALATAELHSKASGAGGRCRGCRPTSARSSSARARATAAPASRSRSTRTSGSDCSISSRRGCNTAARRTAVTAWV